MGRVASEIGDVDEDDKKLYRQQKRERRFKPKIRLARKNQKGTKLDAMLARHETDRHDDDDASATSASDADEAAGHKRKRHGDDDEESSGSGSVGSSGSGGASSGDAAAAVPDTIDDQEALALAILNRK